MDNGHVYPSDYAFQFGTKEPNANGSHKALVDELRRLCPGAWPNLLRSVFVHREACLLAALGALDAALAEPKLTREGLRRQMLAALAAIAERGPEAIA